jgi:hypothetical protein
LCHLGEWRDDMLLAATILTWIAEWLMHYEVWFFTAHWTGGGHTVMSKHVV